MYSTKDMEYIEYTKLAKRIAEFSVPIFYVKKSYNEFISLVNKILETTETLEWGLYAPFPNLEAEMDRLFYNFISSTKLLINTERHFLSDLSKMNCIIVDYEKKKEIFKNNGLVCTISTIRNLYTHEGPLMLTESISIADGYMDRKFVFKGQTLLKIKKESNSCAKQFLSNRKEIDIVEISTEYYNLIMPFYHWLNKELKSILYNNHPKYIDKSNYYHPLLRKNNNKE